MREPGPSDRVFTVFIAVTFFGVLMALGGPEMGTVLIGGAVLLLLILLVLALLGFDL